MPSPERILVAVISAAMVVVVAVFGYAAYGYNEAECQTQLNQTGHKRELLAIFDSAADLIAELRGGTPSLEKWPNAAYQQELKQAAHIVKEARLAAKEKRAFALLGAVTELTKSLVRAKTQAVNRVNDILKVADPANPDAFNKDRLEGKNLVEVVKHIDAVLEEIDRRPKKLPDICEW